MIMIHLGGGERKTEPLDDPLRAFSLVGMGDEIGIYLRRTG